MAFATSGTLRPGLPIAKNFDYPSHSEHAAAPARSKFVTYGRNPHSKAFTPAGRDLGCLSQSLWVGFVDVVWMQDGLRPYI